MAATAAADIILNNSIPLGSGASEGCPKDAQGLAQRGIEKYFGAPLNASGLKVEISSDDVYCKVVFRYPPPPPDVHRIGATWVGALIRLKDTSQVTPVGDQ